MEQPPTPIALPSNPSPPKDNSSNNKRRPPSPEEVVAHYESLGLDSKGASLKAIGDLQALLFRTAGKKDRFITDAVRKLDNINTRLAILEMKLDSKPGFPESIAIGVTSGALLHGIGSALPHLGRIWDSVKTATRSAPPSS